MIKVPDKKSLFMVHFFVRNINRWLYRWVRWFILLLNKTSLEIRFIYLDNKEISSIFKMYCLICFIFQKIPYSSFFGGGGGGKKIFFFKLWAKF